MKNSIIKFLQVKYLLILLILFTLLYAIYLQKHNYIRADGANHINVARNLFAGKGFSSESLWHYFVIYDQPLHPEDNWPILQTSLIALFIKVFGDTLFIAKLPGLFYYIVFVLSVYHIGKRIFDEKTAVLTGIFVVINPFILDIIFRNTFDLGAAVFFLWGIYFAAQFLEHGKTKALLWSGISGGLLYMQSGAPAVTFLGVLNLFLLFRLKQKFNLLPIIFFNLVFFLTASPLLLKNYLYFNDPFYTLERIEALVHILNIDYVYLDFPLRFNPFDISQIKDILIVIKANIYLLSWILIGNLYYLIISLFGIYYYLTNQRRDYFLNFLGYSFILYTIIFHFFLTTAEERYYLFLLIPASFYFSKILIKTSYSLKGQQNILWLALLVIIIKLSLDDNLWRIVYYFRHPTVYSELNAYQWINNNIEKRAVFMTKEPDPLNYYTRNPAVNIPPPKYDVDFEKTTKIMKKFGVQYLFLDELSNPQRLQLLPLYEKKEVPGFKKVYEIPQQILIYEVSL